MIYIKRILYVIGYFPMSICMMIIAFIGVTCSPLIEIFYYIKNGDIETIPDWALPLFCAAWLEKHYKQLEPKL